MRFRFNKPVGAIIKSSGVNSRTLAFAAKQACELMHEFVPFDTGKLASSAITEGDKGRVTYTAPYARFCYYGESKNFCREKHPKAGAFWDRLMMQVHGRELHSRVNNFIKNRA